jgi:thiamine phosphate synthase YjbQ (UPF0047 family)
VERDIEAFLDARVPREGDYKHAEGNSDSHIKALLTGNAQMLPVESACCNWAAGRRFSFANTTAHANAAVWVQIIADSETRLMHDFALRFYT